MKYLTNDELIGLPFKWAGRDEQGMDCYGLAMYILNREGVCVPDIASPKKGADTFLKFLANIPLWVETDVKPLSILLFKIPSGYHVGVYEGDGMFIHTWEKSGGVVRERISVWDRKLIGAYEYVR